MAEKPLAVIAHGYASSPNWIWIPGVRRNLEAVGYQTLAPRMPLSRQPALDEWTAKLEDSIGEQEDATLIAHSCSGRSALHYVETHPTSVRNLIVISSFVDSIGDKMPEPWTEFYSHSLNTTLIRNNCPNIVGLYSEDDPVIPFFSQADLFSRNLGRVLSFKSEGHFLGKTLPIDLIPLLR